MAKQSINSKCPCGSDKKYKKCCMIFHKGAAAKDAITLMKSRYSAFAMAKIEYIIKTSIYQKDYDDLLSFSKNCNFLELKVLDFEDKGNEAFVTFSAKIICDGIDSSFSEKSRFIYKDDVWLYESGEIF
jgi:SEC-C motif-containing protein